MPGNDNKTDKNENVSISYKNFKGDFPVNKAMMIMIPKILIKS